MSRKSFMYVYFFCFIFHNLEQNNVKNQLNYLNSYFIILIEIQIKIRCAFLHVKTYICTPDLSEDLFLFKVQREQYCEIWMILYHLLFGHRNCANKIFSFYTDGKTVLKFEFTNMFEIYLTDGCTLYVYVFMFTYLLSNRCVCVEINSALWMNQTIELPIA